MPLECEFFALRGIALLTDTIAKVQDRLNPRLEVLGILGTMYDPRTLHSREVLERVVEAFGDTVFHSVIRRTVKFPETTVAGEPITSYASTSAGRGLLPDLCQRGAAALSERMSLPRTSVPPRIPGGSAGFGPGPARGEDHRLRQPRRAAGPGAGPADPASDTARQWTAAGSSARPWPPPWPI